MKESNILFGLQISDIGSGLTEVWKEKSESREWDDGNEKRSLSIDFIVMILCKRYSNLVVVLSCVNLLATGHLLFDSTFLLKL